MVYSYYDDLLSLLKELAIGIQGGTLLLYAYVEQIWLHNQFSLLTIRILFTDYTEAKIVITE